MGGPVAEVGLLSQVGQRPVHQARRGDFSVTRHWWPSHRPAVQSGALGSDRQQRGVGASRNVPWWP